MNTTEEKKTVVRDNMLKIYASNPGDHRALSPYERLKVARLFMGFSLELMAAKINALIFVMDIVESPMTAGILDSIEMGQIKSAVRVSVIAEVLLVDKNWILTGEMEEKRHRKLNDLSGAQTILLRQEIEEAIRSGTFPGPIDQGNKPRRASGYRRYHIESGRGLESRR